MTMVVPCRLITRQRSHIGLTDGRTFISSVPVGDSTAVEVVRAELHLDLVPGEDADVVLAHLPGDRGENVSQLHWDIVKDLRKSGRLELDGKVVQEAGKWLI